MKLAARMNRLGTESAFEVLARARAMENLGRKVIHLEIGEPDFDTPPHICEAAERAIRDGYTHYVPAPGLSELREAVAEFLARSRGVTYDPNRIVVTPGAKPFLFYVILALCEQGDEVLYPDPGFPMYESVASFAGATPVPLPLREENDFRVDPDELGELVTERTRLVVINSPHTPCGSALTPEDVEHIAEAVEGRDLFVISDEVYWAMRYAGEHRSIAAVDGMAERTVLLDGCSKTYAMTGWRLGFAALPQILVEPVTRLIINSVSCTAAFVQMAAIAALNGPHDAVQAMLEEFRRRRGVIVSGLNDIEGWSCPEPMGAFYAFANIKETGGSSDALAAGLLEEAGVACLAGTAFGRQGEGYVRFSYANSIPNIRDALESIAAVTPQLAFS